MAITDSKSLWIWQTDQLGERTIEEMAQTALQYANASVLLLKIYDGQFMMGGVDTGHEAVRSISQFRDQQHRAKAAGVDLYGWVNPHNHTDAALHATVDTTLVVDLEPYKGFWTDTPLAVVTYLQALRSGGVEHIYMSIDPREAAVTALGLPHWVHLVDGLLPQIYWTDFQQDASVVIPMLDALVQYGVPVIPVFPYNGSESDMQNVWQAAKRMGITGASLWRMGVADASALQAFGRLDTGSPVQPDYQKEIEDLQARNALLEQALVDIRSIITNVPDALS